MPKMIFVNLPVADLQKSIDFYKAVGAEQNLQFSDDTAAMMSFSAEINVMLLTHDKFRQFTSKKIVDARDMSQVLLALSMDSREDVDGIAEKAFSAGGREARPVEDHGWMYCRPFEDLDGHTWEPVWMNMEAAPQATGGTAPV